MVGNGLNLNVGGLRAYNQTNLYSRKSEEQFKLFIGFKNSVCTNLCVSTDGFSAEVKVRTVAELANAALNLMGNFNVYREIEKFNNLPNTMITESQFAQIIYRFRDVQYTIRLLQQTLIAIMKYLHELINLNAY